MLYLKTRSTLSFWRREETNINRTTVKKMNETCSCRKEDFLHVISYHLLLNLFIWTVKSTQPKQQVKFTQGNLLSGSFSCTEYSDRTATIDLTSALNNPVKFQHAIRLEIWFENMSEVSQNIVDILAILFNSHSRNRVHLPGVQVRTCYTSCGLVACNYKTMFIE